jgi:hypothetical protein
MWMRCIVLSFQLLAHIRMVLELQCTPLDALRLEVHFPFERICCLSVTG